MFDSFESTVGQRIRYYRMLAQMTQKELAETCGISEPAIRNYELGNRIPGIDTLGDIADALRVSYYALADPDLASLAGVMQTLFRLEYAYGIRPIEVDGTTMLQIDPKYTEQFAPYFQMALNRWLAEKKKLDSGEIGPGAYEDWESRYMSAAQSPRGKKTEPEKAGTTASERPKQKRVRKPKKTQ